MSHLVWKSQALNTFLTLKCYLPGPMRPREVPRGLTSPVLFSFHFFFGSQRDGTKQVAEQAASISELKAVPSSELVVRLLLV